jgi:hypothetical protein
MPLSEFDKEFLQELRRDFQNDLYARVEQEHAKGLHSDPHYGMTQREIDMERASLECDRRKNLPNEEDEP